MDHQGNDQSGSLSANAAVFIPRNYAPPLGTAPIQNLPTYMTNCFPFVQPDFNGNRPTGNHGNWSRNSRPNRFGNRNNSGHHGNRLPAPNKFSEPPLFPFTSPPPPDPFFNQFVPPPNNVFISNLSSLPVMPSGTPYNGGQEQTEDNNNTFTSNNRRRRKDKNGNSNVRRSNENLDEGGKKNENSHKQRRRTHSGRKGGSLDTTQPPVLVLYERDVQTDFSESFSHMSLAQHPSPLFKSSSHRRHLRQHESMELDLDSDSGYSSPLHRKNQVCSATQSDSITPWVMSSSSIKSDDPSIVHAATVPQQKFSYAFIAQKEPSPQPVLSVDNQKKQDNYKEKRQKQVDRNNSNQERSNFNRKDNRSRENKSNSRNTYDPNSQHINKNIRTQFDGGGKLQGDIQSKGHQGKRPGQKHFNDSEENTKGGYSRSARFEENDYGFSRTKNLNTEKQGERKNLQESKSMKSLKNGKLLQNDKHFENQRNEVLNDEKEDDDNGETGKKKRRRRRRRKKKNKDGEPDSQEEGKPDQEEGKPDQEEVELHFEDVEEFPDLSSAKVSDNMATGISYSAILQQTKPVQRSSVLELEKNKTSSSEESPRKDNSNLDIKGTRASRRRRKRKDILNKAAENELAEIGLEQQMLKEQCLKTTGQKSSKDEKGQTPGILKINPKTQASGKKSKQNVSLDLGAVIDALEQKKTTISLTSVPRKEQKPKPEQPKKKESQKSKGTHNVLDANAPIKRGKERETPKLKKPSPLKKVILKEREEKKHLRMLEGPESASTEAPVGIGVVSGESDLSQDAMSTKSSVDYTGTPGSANLSPISQTSPISMSPLSPGTSPLSSEVNSPIAGAVGKDVVRKIHSRRFREYCNQVLDKDIDDCATTLLQDLVRFQDRMYHKDPTKAKLKRRLVLGLREVAKHLKLKKIKCVIISPNLEKIQSKGGLDDALNNILNLCNEQNVPFVFALGRRALGRACAKLVPVSVVGIFNFSGSEENFKRLIDLTEKARESYGEMVDAIEKEIKEYPIKIQQPTIPHVFAHMGHSRTPSGASVLSLTSSILSEPISENYPHSEPETDSKGYEIVKDDALLIQGLPTSPSGYQTQMRIIHSNRKCNLDDGNEADNEEEGIKINKNSLRTSEENLSLDSSDMVSALPHIDSIHSSTHDLNTEILSQHSGRTLENCEAMSTHSSRTLGDGSSTMLADMGDRSKHGTPKSTESPSNTLQRGKIVDEERLQQWVDETSSRLETLALEEESYEDSTDEMTESEDESSNSDEKDNSGTLKKKNKSENINNDFSDCPTQIKSSDDNQIKHGNTYNNMEEHDGKGKDNSDSVNRLKCEENIDTKRSEMATGSEDKMDIGGPLCAIIKDCDSVNFQEQKDKAETINRNLSENCSGEINVCINNSFDCEKKKIIGENCNVTSDRDTTAPGNVEIHFD